MGIKGRDYIDPDIHGRFDRRNTAFYRRDTFTGFDHFQPETNDPGNPELPALAEARVSWLLHDYFPGAFVDSPVGERHLVKNRKPFRFTFSSASAATENIMGVAKRFGASLTGIALVEERWLYSNERNGSPVMLPDGAGMAVVMAVSMDAAEISRSPSLHAAAESGRGYSKMAALAGAMGEYLRLLGYYARSCGNDTALSIPMAVDAGLGVLGRNGLLLTREFGPRVRLCKVITDLEMIPTSGDYPSSEEVCSDCTLCVDACEADALSSADEPSWEILTESNNPGIRRWQFNPEKCLDFWIEIGRDCSNCISACPASSRLKNLMR